MGYIWFLLRYNVQTLPVVLTGASKQFSYDVKVSDRVGTTWQNVPQENIREGKRASLPCSPPSSSDQLGDPTTDDQLLSMEHELEAAALAKTTDDHTDEEYRVLECCGICQKRGRPERYCPDCTIQYCTECGDEETCVDCLRQTAEENDDPYTEAQED